MNLQFYPKRCFSLNNLHPGHSHYWLLFLRQFQWNSIRFKTRSLWSLGGETAERQAWGLWLVNRLSWGFTGLSGAAYDFFSNSALIALILKPVMDFDTQTSGDIVASWATFPYFCDHLQLSRKRCCSCNCSLPKRKRGEIPIHPLTEPQDYFIHIEGVLHIAVHQSGRIHKGHQAEALLPRRADLSAQVFRDTWGRVRKWFYFFF